MDRANVYFLNETDQNTYDYDETLPPLPLPELHETMERYYESIKPFGTEEELAASRGEIAKFENGIGAKLHEMLKERAAKKKNWLGDWWEAYAYHTLRVPLKPYTVMAMPVDFSFYGIQETPEHFLKNLARVIYHTVEFWDLLHKAKIKPLSSNGGKIKYSSNLYKRFYSTTRVPGLEMDHLESHFKIATEGKTPSHGLISGKGRLFIFNTIHADGTILSPQEILVVLQRIRATLDYEPMGDCVPILTHDNRSSWANNRQQLLEISEANRETLKLVESSNIVIVLDENEPNDVNEITQLCVYGDYHSSWADRTSTIIAYKNGKFACIGEHSAYDGTISVSFIVYIEMCLTEEPEPDWNDTRNGQVVSLRELKFDLSDNLKQEIKRVLTECNDRGLDVIATLTAFEDYGKDFIKTLKLHPDSYVQVVMQLAYLLMHNEIAPTYETALMRQYYNGRTETLRSCTPVVSEFLKIAVDPTATKRSIVSAFRAAVEHHNTMMNEARKGHGIDRHLFGLWCIAYDNKIDIPDFYEDTLYTKSGGGGNFVLSTSTLGYSPNVGFVSPMVLDGYGVFYTITPQTIFIISTAYRDSVKTSAYKYNEAFKRALHWIKVLLEEVQISKL